MNLPSRRRSLELRGTISDVGPRRHRRPTGQIALAERPDIVSFRLGVRRAEADVRLAKANAYSDVYVLWQPYTFQDNSPYGLKSADLLGARRDRPPADLQPQPGRDRAGQVNVGQSQIQLTDLERQALIDVEEAIQEYEVTRRQVDAARGGDPRGPGNARGNLQAPRGRDEHLSTTSPPSSSSTKSSSSISTPRSATGGACCRSIPWWAADHAVMAKKPARSRSHQRQPPGWADFLGYQGIASGSLIAAWNRPELGRSRVDGTADLPHLETGRRAGRAPRAALAGDQHHGRQPQRPDQFAQGSRALLSQVSPPTSSATAAQAAPSPAPVAATASGSSTGGFVPSASSIALDQNQGFLSPANPGYNLLLQPTGTATPGEVKRQLFTAVYRGPYIITPGGSAVSRCWSQ